MTKEEVLTYIMGCEDTEELRGLAKLAWDQMKKLESKPADPVIAAKLRLAAKGSVLKVKWRGQDDYEAEFERLNRTTVSAYVRELGKSYRFPIGWVIEVSKPDGKKRSMPQRLFGRGNGRDNDEPGGRLRPGEQ